MLNGILNLPWWGVVITFLVFVQITIACVTLYLHRSQAHKGVEFHPALNYFFRFWLWLTTGMGTRPWVAIHRKHHAKCETEEDPHSPVFFGLKKVLLEGAELYRAESANQETMERYGKGTPDDWLERNIYSRHSVYGVLLMMVIDLLLFGVVGLAVWAVQMMWIPFFAAGVINGIGHYWGYRNFDCKDASTNLIPWAFFVGGEELHNNHHTYPGSAKLSVKWWEFDIGWMYITILKSLKLAKVKKVPPKLARVPGKMQIDADTLRALFANPLQILARYSNDVIMPVLRQEKRKAGETGSSIFHKAKALLLRENAMATDETSKQKLASLLEKNQPLGLVYDYRQKLQAIWARTSASQKEMLDALQEWCKQAEATGVEVLQKFAGRLKTYVPMTA